MVLGLSHVRVLPTLPAHNWALQADTLEAAISADKAAELLPFYAVGTVGTTSSCAVDDLPAIGNVTRRWDGSSVVLTKTSLYAQALAACTHTCSSTHGAMSYISTLDSTVVCTISSLHCEPWHRHGVWLHVDAAYAGSAAVCPEQRTHFAGLELAESYSFNPHKW